MGYPHIRQLLTEIYVVLPTPATNNIIIHMPNLKDKADKCQESYKLALGPYVDSEHHEIGPENV